VVVKLEIRGHDLPGRAFTSDGALLSNVHVGIQLGRDPAELVPGDAPSAVWRTTVDVLDRDGVADFRGPAVQGRRGERFVYLTWGDVTSDGSFAMFRRAKLMLADLPPADRVVAVVRLTDERGGPACARLRPPALVVGVL
jgi:hypothetical protein